MRIGVIGCAGRMGRANLREVLETDGAKGFRRGPLLDKIGMKAQDTAELFFDGVRVPAENLLGAAEGQGFVPGAARGLDERLRVALVDDLDRRERDLGGIARIDRLVASGMVSASSKNRASISCHDASRVHARSATSGATCSWRAARRCWTSWPWKVRSKAKIASMRRTASTASGATTGVVLRRFLSCAAASASTKK